MISDAQFIELHDPQLRTSGVPRLYWEALNMKINQSIFDAGLNFRLVRVEYEQCDELAWKVVVSNPDGVSASENANVYLVDHAWTYHQNNARDMLSSTSGLLHRMCHLMDIDLVGDDTVLVERVMQKQWLYNQTYSFANFDRGSEEAMPVWYIMDEFGSRIQHSDEPCIKAVPFFHQPTGTAYTVFWPLRDLVLNDEVTRDFVSFVPATEELQRQAHLLPWQPCDFTDIDEAQLEPDASYFKISRYEEADLSAVEPVPLLSSERILIWTSDPVVEGSFTDKSRYKTTENREEAQIVWQRDHIRDFGELAARNVYINQFPYESILTTKDLLAIVGRRAASRGKSYPRWLQVTYNLNTELPEFLSHYQQRQQRSEDNHWIAKPWNLGRGLGHHITSDVNSLVRLPESGPYIAMKYIEQPVLFDRPDVGLVKFDFRYMIFLKSVKPLRISANRRFFLRFANKVFEMNRFHEHDRHFTVHNYQRPDQLWNVNCEDFIPMWDKQYPDYTWECIQTDTLQCILELIQAAVSRDPPFGIGHSPLSRAQYAFDLMLKWDTSSNGCKVMVPQILECNFGPDCKRAAQNYPDYFTNVFNCLFFEEEQNADNEIVIPCGSAS